MAKKAMERRRKTGEIVTIESIEEIAETEEAEEQEQSGPVSVSEEERECFKRDILREFAEVFGEIEAVSSSRIKPFEIHLKEGAEPFRAKLYRLSPQYEPFIKKEIGDLLV